MSATDLIKIKSHLHSAGIAGAWAHSFERAAQGKVMSVDVVGKHRTASTGAEIVAMTATPAFHAFTADTEMLEAAAAQFAQTSRERGERLLDDVAAVAREADVPRTCVQLVSDHPYEAIIDTARDQRCDLIVMASYGHRASRDC